MSKVYGMGGGTVRFFLWVYSELPEPRMVWISAAFMLLAAVQESLLVGLGSSSADYTAAISELVLPKLYTESRYPSDRHAWHILRLVNSRKVFCITLAVQNVWFCSSGYGASRCQLVYIQDH